jgi:GGDEF domain-containing protein
MSVQDIIAGLSGKSSTTQYGIGYSPKIDSTPPSNVVSEADVDSYIEKASKDTGVPAEYIKAILKTEAKRTGAGYDSSARSPTGATGLMQILPSTAKSELDMSESDLLDPEKNVYGGARYIKKLLDRNGGDFNKAATRYLGLKSGQNADALGTTTEKYLEKVNQNLGGATPEYNPDTQQPIGGFQDKIKSILSQDQEPKSARKDVSDIVAGLSGGQPELKVLPPQREQQPEQEQGVPEFMKEQGLKMAASAPKSDQVSLFAPAESDLKLADEYTTPPKELAQNRELLVKNENPAVAFLQEVENGLTNRDDVLEPYRMKEHPVAAIGGRISGGAPQMFAGGAGAGAVAKDVVDMIPLFKMIPGGVKVAQLATGALAMGGLNAPQEAKSVIDGKKTFGEALKDEGQSTAVGAILAGAGIFVPPGIWNIAAQPIAGSLVDIAGDALRGKLPKTDEDSKQYVIEKALSGLMYLGFSLKDNLTGDVFKMQQGINRTEAARGMTREKILDELQKGKSFKDEKTGETFSAQRAADSNGAMDWLKKVGQLDAFRKWMKGRDSGVTVIDPKEPETAVPKGLGEPPRDMFADLRGVAQKAGEQGTEQEYPIAARQAAVEYQGKPVSVNTDGEFYPGDPEELEQQIRDLLEQAGVTPPASDKVISPGHVGPNGQVISEPHIWFNVGEGTSALPFSKANLENVKQNIAENEQRFKPQGAEVKPITEGVPDEKGKEVQREKGSEISQGQGQVREELKPENQITQGAGETPASNFSGKKVRIFDAIGKEYPKNQITAQRNKLKLWIDTNKPTEAEFDAYVNRSLPRVVDYLKGEDNAESTGKKIEEGSGQEGAEGETGGGIRVRNDEKNGVETQEPVVKKPTEIHFQAYKELPQEEQQRVYESNDVTGKPGQRAFNRVLAEKTDEYKKPVTFAFGDINGFGHYNNVLLGPKATDEYNAKVYDVIKKHVPELFNLHGDEYMILSDESPEVLHNKIKDAMTELGDTPFTGNDGKQYKTTMTWTVGKGSNPEHIGNILKNEKKNSVGFDKKYKDEEPVTASNVPENEVISKTPKKEVSNENGIPEGGEAVRKVEAGPESKGVGAETVGGKGVEEKPQPAGEPEEVKDYAAVISTEKGKNEIYKIPVKAKEIKIPGIPDRLILVKRYSADTGRQMYVVTHSDTGSTINSGGDWTEEDAIKQDRKSTRLNSSHVK